MAGTAHLAVHELLDVHDAHAQPRRHVVVVRQEEQLLVVHRLPVHSSFNAHCTRWLYVSCVFQSDSLLLQNKVWKDLPHLCVLQVLLTPTRVCGHENATSPAF